MPRSSFTTEKRTKIRSRIIASELMRLLRSDGNVIIQGHRFADHDCIASCIGVAKMAMIAGKKPKIVVNINDANLKPIFAMMRGSDVYNDMFVDALEAWRDRRKSCQSQRHCGRDRLTSRFSRKGSGERKEVYRACRSQKRA